jgi:hypothetical protein
VLISPPGGDRNVDIGAVAFFFIRRRRQARVAITIAWLFWFRRWSGTRSVDTISIIATPERKAVDIEFTGDIVMLGWRPVQMQPLT